MVHARLLCSAEDCAAVYHAYGPLEEIQALACDCGCGLELLAWPEPVEEDVHRTEGIVLLPS